MIIRSGKTRTRVHDAHNVWDDEQSHVDVSRGVLLAMAASDRRIIAKVQSTCARAPMPSAPELLLLLKVIDQLHRTPPELPMKRIFHGRHTVGRAAHTHVGVPAPAARAGGPKRRLP